MKEQSRRWPWPTERVNVPTLRHYTHNHVARLRLHCVSLFLFTSFHFHCEPNGCCATVKVSAWSFLHRKENASRLSAGDIEVFNWIHFKSVYTRFLKGNGARDRFTTFDNRKYAKFVIAVLQLVTISPDRFPGSCVCVCVWYVHSNPQKYK